MGFEAHPVAGGEGGEAAIPMHRHAWSGDNPKSGPVDATRDTQLILSGLACTLVVLALVQRICRVGHKRSEPRARRASSTSSETDATKQPASPTTKDAAEMDRLYMRMAWLYLPPYFTGVFADWMLGPYVYAVYTQYGYTMSEIGTLYVVGFVSSLSVGTMMGPFADRYGRRAAALAFCGIYVFSCACKNVGAYSVLMVGRFFGGVGTSLLYTAFESWAVYTFDEAGLDDKSKSRLFAMATFGNALSAVVAGLVTYPLNESYGPVAPFNAAIVPLIVCGGWILSGWNENYGSRRRTMKGSLFEGVGAIFNNRRVFMVGVVSALFEAVLYIFVFIWTPSLQLRAANSEVPLGLVFACYMTAKMCGTYAFEHLISVSRSETVLTCVLAVSALSFAWPVWHRGYFETLMAHCVFEFSVGMYWPAVSTLRSECISEDLRSTTMSLFRVPLNLFVVFSLSGIDTLTDVQVYRSCSMAMIMVAIAHYFLVSSIVDH
eukprot:m.18980 g.18980  ORF g.18980 m.18980 type:complete len:490 (+) comp3647_c0_seq1:257-1726(+)